MDRPGGRRRFLSKALFRNNGIARRLIVAMVLFSSVITAVATSFELYLDYRADIHRIDDSFALIRKTFIPSLTDSVWVGERGQIETQLRGLLNLPDIERVEITADGNSMWSAGSTISFRIRENHIQLTHAHRDGMVVIGDLHVVASVDAVIKRISGKLVVILVSNGVRTLLVTTFLLLLFQYLVGQHLETIAGYLRGVARSMTEPGTLRLNRPDTGAWRPDALDYVVRSVNRMRDELSTLMKSLSETNQTLASIVSHAPVAICTTDQQGAITIWNPAAETLFGRSSDQTVGMPAASVLSADTEVLTALRQKADSHDHEALELRYSRPDGTARDLVIVIARLGDPVQALQGYLIIAMDVTQRKEVEEQLRQAQKMETVGQLTGGVAHDFNNLLGVICGSLELLNESLSDPVEAQELIESALHAAERGASLTRSLLAFSRRQALRPRPICLNELLAEMATLLRRTIPGNIDFVLDMHDTWLCEADPGQLQQAVLNLVGNARDAMPKGGRLIIETRDVHRDGEGHPEIPPGDYLMLSVTDTGTGMSAEIVAKVFEPFFTTKPEGKGTGLGLSMVYGFARQSGGHVDIESEMGRGTTLTLLLPRYTGALLPAAPIKPTPGRRGRGETILLVEDDPAMAEVVSSMLEHLGYAVIAAGSAQGALDMLRDQPAAVMLTDLILSDGLNGFQLANAARALRPDLKVLLMSGYSEEAVYQHGQPDDDMPLLQKPFHLNELGTSLRAILD